MDTATATDPAPASGMSIAEAAAHLGLTPDTLRYYEKDGLLLRPVRRATSGHRRYEGPDLRWVELVTRLRSTGMPIRDVRRYADLVRAGAGNEPERLALLQEHRRAVLVQLAEVQEHLGAIDHKIGIYTDLLERADGAA
ncbi:MerR family transcriptional regulator [Nocardioides dongxiaopingii]|uniref:MerR family transcriptional regulator n=1 Tax=Nocardioides sp. S-1144 TaxID=2582905 RepID=UPI00165254A6|nr:MerR family transcriptional regulator [Nocardioides sp. S-1144]